MLRCGELSSLLGMMNMLKQKMLDCNQEIVGIPGSKDENCTVFLMVKFLMLLRKLDSILKIVNATNHKIKEWMTLGLLTSALGKNNLSNNVKKKYHSNLILRRFYNTYRNKFNTIVRLTKKNFHKK